MGESCAGMYEASISDKGSYSDIAQEASKAFKNVIIRVPINNPGDYQNEQGTQDYQELSDPSIDAFVDTLRKVQSHMALE